MRRRRCVRPTSATHISKTSTQVPSGYDDGSMKIPRRERRASRHAARFARLPTTGVAYSPTTAGGTAATLTPPSPSERGAIAARSKGQDRFPRRPVKSDGCHGPRRRPPSSGSPRTEDPRDRLRHPSPSTSFADAGLPAGLGPRPPPRPQPRWLLWARRCSMISATKTESGAHHPSAKTSRAPR